MSLDATRWAWMQTGISSSDKLVLLSLADRADEAHVCYPSIARLTADTLLDRKTVMRSISRLCDGGLLVAMKVAGEHSKYRLVGVGDRHQTSTEIGTSPKNGTGTKNGTAPVPNLVPPPVPNLGHESTNEPTKNRTSRAQAREAIPFERIVELYHEHLPMLPRVVALTDKRRKAIAARWADGMPLIGIWESYFVAVSESDFLCGRTPRSSWRADIDFLTKPDTPVKVEEGKYANSKVR